jgi:hypothetical protein
MDWPPTAPCWARYIVLALRLNLPAKVLFTGSCKFYQFAEQKISCLHYPTRKQISGEITMPTPKEYRQQACECLELSDKASQWYLKTALLQLAVEFLKRAKQLERSQTSLYG